jgi:hypothetical protein
VAARQAVGSVCAMTDKTGRPIFTIRVRAERGVDPVPALRGLLKSMLRRHGLRSLECQPDHPTVAVGDITPQENVMSDESKLKLVADPQLVEQLDADEKEFRQLRRDLPGVKGASAAGIVAISVGKTPVRNEFFRSHREFRPIVPVVDLEVGMEKQFFAVSADMIEALAGIGITVSDCVCYLTVTLRGAFRVVPVRQAGADGEQNEYHRTKEIGLIQAIDEWVRLYTDQENRCYKVFPAPEGRFGEPQWPDLKPAKIFRLAFRDKGRLVDSTEHPLFKKWAARDTD